MPGKNKDGNPEYFSQIDIYPGEIVGVVGPTGSGKSAFIEDIEQLAQADTATHRRVLINGSVPDISMRFDPKKKMIAQLSQNMNFLADMTVRDFLMLHAKCRGKNPDMVENV